jgi:hypothetical protein
LASVRGYDLDVAFGREVYVCAGVMNKRRIADDFNAIGEDRYRRSVVSCALPDCARVDRASGCAERSRVIGGVEHPREFKAEVARRWAGLTLEQKRAEMYERLARSNRSKPRLIVSGQKS